MIAAASVGLRAGAAPVAGAVRAADLGRRPRDPARGRATSGRSPPGSRRSSAYVLFSNGWRESDGLFISGGWNWSDLLVHVAIGSSIVHGNFPPEVPYFAGVPLTYHWFADFHGADRVAWPRGSHSSPVYFVTSALFAGVLALVVWALALRLTRDRTGRRSSRRSSSASAAAWAGSASSSTCSDGCGRPDVLAPEPVRQQLARHAGRSSGSPRDGDRASSRTGRRRSACPGCWPVLLLVVTCLRERPAGVLMAGLLAALLAPFQFYAFPATYLIVGLYVLRVRGVARADGLARRALFLAPVVLAIPFIAGRRCSARAAARVIRFVTGLGRGAVRGWPAGEVLFFYITNLGFPFALAHPRGGRGARVPSHRVPRRVDGRGLFLVPNLVVVARSNST